MHKLFKRNHKSKKNRGFSLLEFAMVVPPMLIVAFCAMDVTKLIQARTALKQGVETTLRCLYPVNGECLQLEAQNSETLVDWVLFDQRSTPWTRKFYYTATERYVQKDYFTAIPTATVLEEISFSAPHNQYSANVNYYNATADAQDLGVLMIANKPKVQVPNPNDVKFKYNDETTDYTASKITVMPSQRKPNLNSDGTTPDSGSYSFIVDAPIDFIEGAECYRSTKINKKPSAEHTKGESCGKNFAEVGNIVVFIEGTGSTSVAGEKALVKVEISNYDVNTGRNELKDHGGRLFDAPDSNDANFVPRGVGENSQYSEKYIELEKHHTVRVKYGKPVRMKFTLSSGAPASWNFTDVTVFTPKFRRLNEATTVNCSEQLLKSDIVYNKKGKCITEAKYKVTKINSLSPDQEADKVEALQIGTYPADQNIHSGNYCNAMLSNPELDIKMTSSECNMDSTLNQPSKVMMPKTIECPSDNLGVVDFSDEKEKSAACPATEGATNLLWSTKEVVLAPVKWTPSSCNDTDARNHATSPYKSVQYSDHSTEPSQEKQLREGLPKEYQSHINAHSFDCFETVEVKYDKVSDKLEANSFFKTYQFDKCNWEDYVRNVAEREKDTNGESIHNANAYIEAARNSETHIPINPSDIAKTCTVDYPDVYLTGGKQTIAHSVSSAAPIPDECKAEGAVCRSEVVSIATTGTNELTHKNFTDERTVAKQIGLSEMNVAYPALTESSNCTEDECVTMDISDIDNDGYINVEATVNVPLSLLMGGEITLTHNDRERWEGAFVQ